MSELLGMVPPWLGVVAWMLVLVGFLLQRSALQQKSRVHNAIKGNENQVVNTVHQSVTGSPSQEDSALARWGSWASIVGLVLTLLPLVKAWLAPGG